MAEPSLRAGDTERSRRTLCVGVGVGGGEGGVDAADGLGGLERAAVGSLASPRPGTSSGRGMATTREPVRGGICRGGLPARTSSQSVARSCIGDG